MAQPLGAQAQAELSPRESMQERIPVQQKHTLSGYESQLSIKAFIFSPL